jgi:hypothetical protein
MKHFGPSQRRALEFEVNVESSLARMFFSGRVTNSVIEKNAFEKAMPGPALEELLTLGCHEPRITLFRIHKDERSAVASGTALAGAVLLHTSIEVIGHADVEAAVFEG